MSHEAEVETVTQLYEIEKRLSQTAISEGAGTGVEEKPQSQEKTVHRDPTDSTTACAEDAATLVVPGPKFDMHDPAKWHHFSDSDCTQNEAKGKAIAAYVLQHDVIQPQWSVPACRKVLETMIWMLLESNVEASTFKTKYLKPTPSKLPPAVDLINKLKAALRDADCKSGVGFADNAVLGLTEDDIERFVLPGGKGDSTEIVDPRFAWDGIPSGQTVIVKKRSTALIVTGESGGGKTTLLLLLLKAILERLVSIEKGKDPNFEPEKVAAVTAYLKPTEKFRNRLREIEKELKSFDFDTLSEDTSLPPPKQLALLTPHSKQLLYHIANVPEEQRSKKRQDGIEEDAVLRDAISSWKGNNEPGSSPNTNATSHHKIVRNYAMYSVLVEETRTLLKNTRRGDLLSLLLKEETDVKPSAVVVVLALDEVGCDVEASRAVCAVRHEVCAALFPNQPNVVFRMAVAGTGLAASNLPPGSMQKDYYVHHMKSEGIFRKHMHACFQNAQGVCERLITVVQQQPYLAALIENARMAALLAKCLSSFSFEIEQAKQKKLELVSDWIDPSIAELQAAGMLAAKYFKQLNGLKGLQIAKAKGNGGTIFASLLRAMGLHMVPYPNTIIDGAFDAALERLSGALGLVTDRATWNRKTDEGDDVYAESGELKLTCICGSSRHELNRGMLSILALLLFGFIPQRSASGEGLEHAAVITVMLIVAALRDMPKEALKWVLRYGEPLTPSCLAYEGGGPLQTDDLADFSTVCNAMQWTKHEAAAASQPTIPVCYLKQLGSTVDETEFINYVKHCDNIQGCRLVAAALNPPKAAFADAVVGLKGSSATQKDGLLVLIQSKDLKKDLPLYKFFYENHKMGHRGVQSIAGFLASTAPHFGLPPADILATLQLAMFEIAPSLAEGFDKYWRRKMTSEAEKAKQVPSTTYTQRSPSPKDRIDWLCLKRQQIPRAKIFEYLEKNLFLFFESRFPELTIEEFPFGAPCKELQDLKEAYCAKDAMFVTYCMSTSVPKDLRNVVGGEVQIIWSKIEDKDIGIILSDSRRLLCTLPTNQQSVAFQANI